VAAARTPLINGSQHSEYVKPEPQGHFSMTDSFHDGDRAPLHSMIRLPAPGLLVPASPKVHYISSLTLITTRDNLPACKKSD
jgi:hypothetical protein